jgi:hypothetical protein
VAHHERPGNVLCRPEEPLACYFPRDFFLCFFTFKLTMGAFTPVPRETGLGTGCFFDFPAMLILLEATDDRTLQAKGGSACPAPARLSVEQLAPPDSRTRSRMVGLALRPEHWPKPRRPSTRLCARDDGASANRVRVQGQYSCSRWLRDSWNTSSPTERTTA